MFTMVRLWVLPLLMLFVFRTALAASDEQVISFKCGLAIDAVFAAIDRQVDNPVTREAVAKISEDNGEFACFQTDQTGIYIRLQPSDLAAGENRLLFLVDSKTYRVVKTFYGP